MILKKVEEGLEEEEGKRHKIQWSVLLPESKDMMMRSKQNILASASSCAIARDNRSLQQPGTARTSCSTPSVEEDVFYDTRSSVSLQQLLLRSELEDEVLALHKQLEQQQELHAALEKALTRTPGLLPNTVPSHLPAIEQKLLLDIAILEVEVLNLEMQITGLQWRLVEETSIEDDEVVEDLHSSTSPPSFFQQRNTQQVSPVAGGAALYAASHSLQLSGGGFKSPPLATLKELLHVPCPLMQEEEEKDEEPPSPSPPRRSFWSRWNGQDLLCRSARPSVRKPERRSISPMEIKASVTPKHNQHSVSDGKCSKCSKSRGSPPAATTTQEQTNHFLPTLAISPQETQRHSSPVSSEKLQGLGPLCILSSGDHLKDLPAFLLSAKRRLSFWSNMPNEHYCTLESTSVSGTNFMNGEQTSSAHVADSPSEDESGQEDFLSRSESQMSADEDLGFKWSKEPPQSANRLSEEMVQSMAKIYCNLSGASDNSLLLTGIHQSPTSHFANLTPSSVFSLSESLMSDEVLTNDASSDLYKARGKLSWADVGPYKYACEVRWLSVGKEQLECAAHALGKFRLLVEQLQDIDPRIMTNDEKLAFWINVYNALLMHAYLAYGVPRSDLKFFNLMQKAAYCVGGQWVNAALIECCLLKGKAMGHRPQFGIMTALHRHKLNQELIKYGIEQMEPLVNFALCCGAQSSPMVRVYTAEHVHEELGFALHDYVRVAVGISVKGRLLVPKLLYCYAHEIVDDRVLLDWVCDFLPSSQVAVIFKCIQQRRFHLLQSNNNFAVLPFDFSFRYLFPSNIYKKLDL
ncbi:unnamed protein product [Sphagnum troendelagicum]|uniref:Uncharacterized protein n=1 Tax=Sphagnum troendelagicum TaxID=128251 RepID=A0ABP0TVJ0_9BRYO